MRSSTSPVPLRLWRLNRISPPTIEPGLSRIPSMDLAVTLFPHPLSPTIPNVCPGYSSNEAPSTATTVPSSSGKWVSRSLTESRGSPVRSLRVAGLAVRVRCISESVS